MKSRFLTVGVFLCFLLAKGAYAQNQYYLPHFVNGNFGAVYKTSFILFNNSDTSVTTTLKLTDNSGSPLTANISGLGNNSQFTISLDAGATKIYQTDGAGSGQGAATVTATGPIGVSAVFTVSDTAGNFLSESGIAAADLMTDFMLPVDSTGSALTGLALFNPGTTGASLTLTLLNTDGTQAATQSVALNAGNHTAAFVALNFPGQFFTNLSSFRGTMRVQSNVSVAALVLRQTQTSTTTNFTSLPVVARSSTKSTLNLAHIANGNFGTISFKTSFLVFNISQSTASVIISLTKDDGTPLTATIPGITPATGSSFNLSLAPNASVFLQTDGLGAGGSGAASITSSVPIGASAIFTILNAQSQFVTEAGVGDSPVLTSLTLPVDVTGLSDTGLAFFNPGSSSVTVTFKLLDASDSIVGTTTRTISAKGHLAGFVDNPFFPGTSNFRGSLAVTATGGIASTVLRQYNSGANYTTLPTASGTATGKTPPATVVPLLTRTLTGITPPSSNNVTLPAGFLLSGTVSGGGTGLEVVANGGGTSIFAGAVDDSTGKYVIVVPAGTYQLTVFYFPTGTNEKVTVTGSNLATIQVNGNTLQNITLPAVSSFAVSGNVAGLTTLPTGTSPTTTVVFTSTDNTMEGNFALDAIGNFQGVLPSGTYTVSVERTSITFGLLQTQSLLDFYNIGTLTVSGAATSKNFTAPNTATLSGTVSGLSLTSAFGTNVSASDTSAPAVTQLVCCPFPTTSVSTPNALSNNLYQMLLGQNRSYSVGVSSAVFQGQSTLLGVIQFPVSSTPLSLGTANATLNFPMPTLPSTAILSGRVTDTSGNGVANVVITAVTQSISGAANTQYSAFATTDAGGNYSFPVLNGTNFTLSYFPPQPEP